MAEEREGLFRKEALMAPPERLDRLIEIVSPKEWLLLAVIIVLAAGVVAWSLWGRLPATVEADGVLIRPHKIVEIQSQVAGKLLGFNLHVGDIVRPGQVLGVVDQSEIRKQMEEDRKRLAELESQDRTKAGLQAEQLRLQAQDLEAQTKYLSLQSASRTQSLHNEQMLTPTLKKRFDNIAEAVRLGLDPAVSPALLMAQRDYLANQTRIADLQAELSEIASKIKRLSTDQKDIERVFLEGSTARKNQILELRKNLALYDVRLEKNTQITAEQGGRVLEVTASAGQVVGPGYRLATLDEQQVTDVLVCVAYFPVRDGKRIKPGMEMQITPDMVKRERYGGINGRVVSVSTFPVTRQGAAVLLGNSDIAAQLLGGGARIEVIADLEKDATAASGYKWSSSHGPDLPITAGTTASGRVTVEMRTPVSYILPFLRSLSGSD